MSLPRVYPKSRWRETAEKVCPCGDRFTPTATMPRDAWEARVYCSSACAGKAGQEKRLATLAARKAKKGGAA